MIFVRVILNVLPQNQKEIMQTLLSIAEQPGKENGYLRYGIFCDIEDKNIFNLISEWETRQVLDRHIQSEDFGVLLGMKSLLCEPIEIQIFSVSGVEGIESVNSIRKKRT